MIINLPKWIPAVLSSVKEASILLFAIRVGLLHFHRRSFPSDNDYFSVSLRLFSGNYSIIPCDIFLGRKSRCFNFIIGLEWTKWGGGKGAVPSPLQYFPLPIVLPLGKIFFLSLNYIWFRRPWWRLQNHWAPAYPKEAFPNLLSREMAVNVEWSLLYFVLHRISKSRVC